MGRQAQGDRLLYKPRTFIKDEALVDSVTEFAKVTKVEMTVEPLEPPLGALLMVYLEKLASGTGVVLKSPEGYMPNCAVRF